ncbi:DNA/RNA non-specific endonuclease [Streptomyces sp. HUAS ZL42]|uniref:DNA/RNA non-specific endonuclease n=1 Tax=Streptomyces sp. HUAS ZL42 TaxID=3231715 RepID=UPI00345E06FB
MSGKAHEEPEESQSGAENVPQRPEAVPPPPHMSQPAPHLPPLPPHAPPTPPGPGAIQPHPGTPPPWPPPTPPGLPPSGRRRRPWIAGAGLGLAGLVAGLVVALGSDGEDGPDRGPFERAIVQLSSTPVIRYETAAGGAGAFTSDLRVTARGAALGTYSLAGQTLRTLTVDGKTYTRWDSATRLTGTEDKWIAEDSSASAALGLTQAQTEPQTPAAFARSLLTQLNHKSTTLPEPGDPATEIDGVPALRATTPTSDLYVAKEPPYRVLRVAPRTGTAGPSVPPLPSLSIPSLPSLPSDLPTPSFSLPSLPELPSLPSLSLPALPAAQGYAARPAAARAAPAAPSVGTVDVAALPQDEIDKLFREITDSVKELKNAVDGGIQFDLTGSADLKCSGGGCRVTARVTSEVSSSKGKITGGRASATLDAQVQIEGRPAGACTSVAELPLKGTSSISCYDAAAGPVFSAVEAQKKVAAEAQSRAQGGRPVPYTISGTAQAMVTALARVNVAVLLEQVDLDHWLSNLDANGDPGTGTQQRPTATAGPSASPSPTPSGRPSAVPTPSPSEPSPDCSEGRPAGATTLGGGWLLNSSGNGGRTETGRACLRKPFVKHPSAPSVDPVGYKEAQDKMRTVFKVDPAVELARCHIIPAVLGGPNNKRDNLSPGWQRGTNTGPVSMRAFETGAQRELESHPDWTMLYTVEPVYRTASSTIPEVFVMHYLSYDAEGNLASLDNATVSNTVLSGSGRPLNLAN